MSGRWWFRRSLALLSIIGGLCSVAAPALGQAPEAQAAEALFRQAKSLMDAGAFAEACEKFAASHALEPGLGTLLYLGDCYERAGRLASALGTFQTAERLARDRGDATRENLASVRAAALAPRAPTLEVRSGAAPYGADLQITVNGAPLRESDLNRPIPRDAGRYEIRFSAPGYAAYVSPVELKNGGGNGVVVTAPRLVSLFSNSASDTAPPGTEPKPGDSQRVGAWVLAATGVALGATAGLLAVFALAKNDASEASCDPNDASRCGPEGVRLREDAKDLATLATVSGLLGGVCVASGVVLYVSAASSGGGVPEGALVTVQGTLF